MRWDLAGHLHIKLNLSFGPDYGMLGVFLDSHFLALALILGCWVYSLTSQVCSFFQMWLILKVMYHL